MSMLQAQVDELRAMAESVGLAMPQAATLMMEAADTIDRLDAENAKLRERAWDLYCLAYPSTVELEVSDEIYDKYSPCEKCQELHGGKSPCASTAKDMTEECCAPIQANVVADCLRELGVEVDG